MQSLASTFVCTLKFPNNGTVAATPLFGHSKVPHTLIAMGSAALAAAVHYPDKGTQTPRKGQWRSKVCFPFSLPPVLTSSHWSLSFASLFSSLQVVCRQQDVSLVWEITDGQDEETEVSATFTCDFTCDLDLSEQSRTFTYSCHLSDFQVGCSFESLLSVWLMSVFLLFLPMCILLQTKHSCDLLFSARAEEQ